MLGYDGLSLATLLYLAVSLPVCAHILLTKEQESVAVGWIALVLLSPFLGPLLYAMLGVNRVARRAREVRGRRLAQPNLLLLQDAHHGDGGLPQEVFRYGRTVHDLPFLDANLIEPLINGDAAYPAMLEAILEARSSIALSVYIFDYDPTGVRFIEALVAAQSRGVAVRVLVDDIGMRYSRRPIDRFLRKGGIRVARFVPRTLGFLPHLNLRNHRKLLLVDGQVGFIGGMNIRHSHVISANTRHPVRDIHFRVRGPVLDQMAELFEEDWFFATREELELPVFGGQAAGSAVARVVPDGPDHDFEKLEYVILGALGMARKSVRIMTPYFLPDAIFTSALTVTALRGVSVEIILPERSNLPLIGWAMAAKLERLLAYGVKIWYGPPPFDHSKLMVMDGAWALVGSTNWDPRSLRLNFEANLECFDAAFGATLEAYFQERKKLARMVSLEEVRDVPMLIRIRNSIVRLFSPYL